MRRKRKIIVWILTLFAIVATVIVIATYRNVSHLNSQKREAECEDNLRFLGIWLDDYATANRSDHFPATLNSLQDLPTEWTRCPITGKPFAYVGGGLSPSAVPSPIIAYESEAHDGVINFLYADGRVEWFDEQTATEMIGEIRSGKNPPRNPAQKATDLPASESGLNLKRKSLP